MSYSDPMKLFNAMREKEQRKTSGGGNFGNPNLLKFQRGKAYSFRLLWLPSENRDYPMINQYIHHFWDDNAAASKDVSVICPTSQYDLDGEGFKVCPVCSKMSELYKASQEGSTSASEIYKKFKRTLKGYVPVYVVNGPEEDKHKIKIMPYTITFKRYFDEKIFGIKNETAGDNQEVEESESNMIGISAFMYYDPKNDEVVTAGHNFLVTVGTKKVPIGSRMVEMPDYKIEFSMKNSEITDFDGKEITPEYFKSISKEIRFDEDFYKMHNNEALEAFLEKYVNGGTGEVENIDDEEPVPAPQPKVKKVEVEEETSNEDEEEEFEEIKAAPVKKAQPVKKAPAKKPEPEPELEEESENSSSSDDDDLNLDELLKDIDI